MLHDIKKGVLEKVGQRVGFLVGLLIFSTLLFFVGSKFKIIPAVTPYYIVISLVISLHIIYSALKVFIKND